jgi:hypothetical protein
VEEQVEVSGAHATSGTANTGGGGGGETNIVSDQGGSGGFRKLHRIILWHILQN